MTIAGLIAIALLVLTLNVGTTVAVARSPRYEPRQKWLQVALIWLVPVVGAVLTWSLAKDTLSERLGTDLRDHIGGGASGSYPTYDSSHGDAGGGDGGGGGD